MRSIDPPEMRQVAPAKTEEPRRRNLQTIVMMSMVVVAAFVFLSLASESESLSLRSASLGSETPRVPVSDAEGPDGSATTTGVQSVPPETPPTQAGVLPTTTASTPPPTSDANKEKANGVCTDVCTQRRTKISETAFADLLDRKRLIQRVEDAKVDLLDKLRRDYGEYFEPIFVDGATGRYRPVRPLHDVSLDRLKRKLAIKVLSVQSRVAGIEDADFHGCDCATDTALRADEVVASLDPADASVVLEGLGGDGEGLFERYIWATGGHSAAAGHGNLYNETYTSYMEQDLREVFASIGILFEGRNYAMGGTDSATKISMCWKEFFGEDVDFFSWDYGMTDGGDTSKLLHYAYRGLMTKGRPATMLIHYNGKHEGSRKAVIEDLEGMGAAAFYSDEDDMKTMRENFPDSAGIDGAAIAALPEYVRNYKCGDSIEKGDPYCRTDKFTAWGCSPRLKQSTWHPGFKDHAIAGHGLALFFVEILLDTLRDLHENDEAGDVQGLLSKLLQEDIDLHNEFLKAELPALHKNLLKLSEKVETDAAEPGFDDELFFRGPSMCHTARLPSRVRYLGILTETDEVGGPAPVGEEAYYVGYERHAIEKIPSEDSAMRLVYETSKEREPKCHGVVVKPDYPDSWYAGSVDGWTRLTIPNTAEKDFFGYDAKEHQGIIVVHWKKCAWDKCPKNYLSAERRNDWEMKINSQKVAKMLDINHGGYIAVGENSGFRFEPDSNGQYVIELKVNKEGHYVELADFVLY